MATTIRAPLILEVESVSAQTTQLARDFIKNGGRRLLEDALEAADLRGTWKFRVEKPFHQSGQFPKIVLREPSSDNRHSVEIKAKPGDNSTAVLGHLIVDKSKGMTAHEVYSILSGAVHQAERDSEEPSMELEAGLVRATLAAVDRLNRGSVWNDRRRFIQLLSERLGYPTENTTPAADLLSALEKEGSLKQTAHAWVLTLSGRMKLTPDTGGADWNEIEDTAETESPVAQKAATPSVNGAHKEAPAPRSAPSAAPMEALLTKAKLMESLVGDAKKLTALKEKRDKIKTQIAEMQKELTACEGEIQTLAAAIDVGGLEEVVLQLHALRESIGAD